MKYLVVLLSLFITACGEDKPNPLIQKFDKSLATWSSMKAAHPEYQYTKRGGTQPPPGRLLVYGLTTIRVKNDLVISRSFRNDGPIHPSYPDYVETGSQIGSHNYMSEPKTVDQFYDQCKNDVLSKQGDISYNNFKFEIDDQGILKLCSYDNVQPVGCGGSYSVQLSGGVQFF